MMYSNITTAPNTVNPFTVRPADAHQLKCDRFYSQNKTHFIYGGYEGIPETLMVNTIAWLCLLIGFSILRKIAWDYGRIALVSRNEDRRSLLYDTSRYNVSAVVGYCKRSRWHISSPGKHLLFPHSETGVQLFEKMKWTALFYGEHDGQGPNAGVGSQESLDTNIRLQDKGFCSWIPAFFRIKDEHIQRKSGKDAVQYLSFQRYLILFTAIICLFSICVVLPVNFQGDLEGNTQAFGHTTMSNIDTGSATLWVHGVFAVVFLIIAVYMMRHFSVNLQYEDDDQATRTLMVSHIPVDKCFKNIIQQHLREAYPESAIQDIQFAYNISRLVKLDKKRQFATEGRQNSEMIYNKSGIRPLIRPYPCGQLFCCECCGCRQVDAINYYGDEEKRLRDLCEGEKFRAFQEALGIAFVTTEDDEMAARIYTDFRTACKGANNPLVSSVSSELQVYDWSVQYAPAPDNIYWENLSVDPLWWWTKAIVINLVLTILLFFLTTPSIIMNSLDEIKYKKELEQTHSAIIVQFVPTLILWTISALMPYCVYYSDQFIGHWTRTAEHHAVMRKTFIFLLVMVIILPSLGLTSAKAFFEWAITDEDKKFRWQCVFLPGNGAFFVNYVITSAFIGTGLELIRFPELFMYAIRLLAARSAAEKTAVRKAIIWQFQFGCEYAWTLCIFAVVVVYSIPCPLIVPFGLVYLTLKHLVDRYNIYFAYGPSKIDKDIHASAINFVIVAVILLQFNVVFFTILRSEKMHGLSVFSMIALFITLIIFLGRVCFGWFKGLSPISYKVASERWCCFPIRSVVVGFRMVVCLVGRMWRSLQDNIHLPFQELLTYSLLPYQFTESTDAPSTREQSKPFVPKVLQHDPGTSKRDQNGDFVANAGTTTTTYGSTESPNESPEHNSTHPLATNATDYPTVRGSINTNDIYYP